MFLSICKVHDDGSRVVVVVDEVNEETGYLHGYTKNPSIFMYRRCRVMDYVTKDIYTVSSVFNMSAGDYGVIMKKEKKGHAGYILSKQL